MTLMVHSSLSSIGWVEGGPSTVVRALLEAVGVPDSKAKSREGGTLVMPAATPYPSDPTTWTEVQRSAAPIFDLETTPTTLGAIPESFRRWPGTLRSNHPLESVCALGPAAAEIVGEHPLEFSEGPRGPFGKLHALQSWILLLGVGFNRCTALHFAETLVEKRRVEMAHFPILDEARRVWMEVPNVADDNDRLFPPIGERFLALGKARQGKIGNAPSMLFSMRELVEVAVTFFEEVL